VSTLSEITNLLHLLLVMPVTIYTAERSFSSLRRLKTYLKSTMNQKLPTHLALLHCHNETDGLNLETICNEFINRSDVRRNTLPILDYKIGLSECV
jgi:hypothetical protein